VRLVDGPRWTRLERPPLESAAPIEQFALVRLLLTVTAAVAVVVAGFPYEARLIAVTAGIGLPWSLFVFWLARRDPRAGLAWWIAVGDIAVLAVAEVVVPEIYGPVRFGAIFLISAHAQFQGERIGLLVAAFAIAVLVPIAAFTDTPIEDNDLLAFYEVLFSALALAAALIVGATRSSESFGRVRARETTRRTIEAETEVRRKLAESIHDGPVQELVSLGMMLSAANKAVERGDDQLVSSAIDEAQKIAERSVQTLRDEIVSLGPYAFEELSFETAVEQCMPVWRRRYGIDVTLEHRADGLTPELNGALFQIAQEAVTNAGRHAEASRVDISLKPVESSLELVIVDDGKGFGKDPLGPREPGHLGLATMRDRAHLVGGRLEIRSDTSGTRVRVIVPHRD
jgi:signal transduction histidine kinase